MSLLPAWKMGMIPLSAPRASPFRAASGSVSVWRGCFSKIRPFSFWMRPPVRWTARLNGISKRRSTSLCPGARPSSLHIAFPPFGMLTGLSSSRTSKSVNREPIRSCFRKTGNTPAFIVWHWLNGYSKSKSGNGALPLTGRLNPKSLRFCAAFKAAYIESPCFGAAAVCFARIKLLLRRGSGCTTPVPKRLMETTSSPLFSSADRIGFLRKRVSNVPRRLKRTGCGWFSAFTVTKATPIICLYHRAFIHASANHPYP